MYKRQSLLQWFGGMGIIIFAMAILPTLHIGGMQLIHLEQDDPYEKRAFLYLDIISWLESKIDRKPLQNIIKEKAILINRKEKQSIALS